MTDCTSWVVPLDPAVVHEIGIQETGDVHDEVIPVVIESSPNAEVVEEEVFSKISKEVTQIIAGE